MPNYEALLGVKYIGAPDGTVNGYAEPYPSPLGFLSSGNLPVAISMLLVCVNVLLQRREDETGSMWDDSQDHMAAKGDEVFHVRLPC